VNQRRQDEGRHSAAEGGRRQAWQGSVQAVDALYGLDDLLKEGEVLLQQKQGRRECHAGLRFEKCKGLQFYSRW
jgi:hypothetical protein